MNKALNSLIITFMLSPLATAAADPVEQYLCGSMVYTDDDPAWKLADVVGGSQVHVGCNLSDVFALEGRIGYSEIDEWPSWAIVTEKENKEFLDIGLDIVSRLNPEGSFSPYLIFGAGCLGTKTASGSEEIRPSGSAGLGFEWRVSSSAFLIRGNCRFRPAREKDTA